MKQIVITLLAICFAVTVQAQFLYKMESVTTTNKIQVAQVSATSIATITNISPALAGAAGGTITSVSFIINTQTSNANNNQSVNDLAITLGQTFFFGTGNNESIGVVELLSGHIHKNERDRLSFGGTFSNSDSKEATDVKTLLQGGGNFFLSYSYPLTTKKLQSSNSFWALLFRTKLGALLPKSGATTNVIQASFDPGLELLFSLSTHNNDIGISFSFRTSVLWASKDFSDATGFKENLIPYSFITGGIKLKSLGSIVYSQSFLSKNLTGITQPKGSLGFSFTL